MPFRPNLPGPGPFLPFHENPETVAVTPPLDPTQIPWPLFDEFVPGPLPQRDAARDETSDQAWLSTEAGGPDPVFTYFDPPIPGAVPRPSALDETSDQAWLSAEAGPGDVVFDYWQEPPRGAVPRVQVHEENVGPAWLSVEADLSGSIPPSLFVGHDLTSPSADLTVEGSDVSWSPDISAPSFDPTQIPWPLAPDAQQPGVPPPPNREFWTGWRCS